MWSSPDVLKHVKEETDLKLSSLLRELSFNMMGDPIGEYEHVPQGKYQKIIIRDANDSILMNKLEELAHSAKEYNMLQDLEKKSSLAAFYQYDNVSYYPLILLVNKIGSNSDYTQDNFPKTYKMLSKADVISLMKESDMNYAVTMKEVSSPDALKEIMTSYFSSLSDSSTAVDKWLNLNIPTHDFTDVDQTELYALLISEIGESTLIDYISRLDVYRRRGEEDV